MIKRRFFCAALLGFCGALVCVTLLLYEYARADVLGGPLPAPHMPRDIITLTPVEKLGKLMLYDSTLSKSSGLRLRKLPRGRDWLHRAKFGNQRLLRLTA